MKIIKFRAENFQKLKVVEITPDGAIVNITGKCEQGKTTIIDAIRVALGGGTMPAEPIRQGEKKASVMVDLGEFTVTRKFTPSGTTLVIENKDGFKASNPQELLNKIVGKLAFDPLEFSRADSKKQVEMLLSVVNLEIDTARLEKMAGIKLQVDGSALDILNKYYLEVAENRKLTNRQLDAAKKIFAALDEVEKVEPVSVAELVAEKEKAQAFNEVNKNNRLSILEKEVIAKNAVIKRDNVASEIDQLNNQLIAKKEELDKLKKQAESDAKTYTRYKIAGDKLKDQDLTEINNKILTADATNKQAQQYADRAAKQVERDKFQKEYDEYNLKLKNIADYKTEIVSKTKFPVDGLDFASGGITYNGLPFKQASGAQTLRVSTAIGMAINPRLRVMLIDGAESLDSTQMGIISEMASSEDYQLWLTKVSEDEKVGIYIEDGAVKEVGE